jgi:predicted RNA binding protein YcfA (HicA-like mRNA interferase family)
MQSRNIWFKTRTCAKLKWRSSQTPKIPGLNHLQAIKALEKAGFKIIRQAKHKVMSDGTRILTIPRHNPVNALTMGGIVRDQDFHSQCSESFCNSRHDLTTIFVFFCSLSTAT